jgi:hypothetical protein
MFIGINFTAAVGINDQIPRDVQQPTKSRFLVTLEAMTRFPRPEKCLGCEILNVLRCAATDSIDVPEHHTILAVKQLAEGFRRGIGSADGKPRGE